jgi:hypothetical protein
MGRTLRPQGPRSKSDRGTSFDFAPFEALGEQDK